MFWNVITALQETKDWGPIPDDQWMNPDLVEDSNMVPPPPPPPDGGDGGTDSGLRIRSHKEEDPIDTPEIQGEEE
jgi:hypothetical protein